MSLINDALKRASQTEPPPAPPIDLMQPVFYARAAKWPLMLMPVILICVLAVAGWFFMKSWQTARHLSLTAPSIVAARGAAQDSAPGGPSKPASPTPPPAVNEHPDSTNNASDAPLSTAVAQAPDPVPAPPSFPTLKLQGVFYRDRGASVLINSKLLHVGDKVDKARVLSISREGAVVEWEGETRQLFLP